MNFGSEVVRTCSNFRGCNISSISDFSCADSFPFSILSVSYSRTLLILFFNAVLYKISVRLCITSCNVYAGCPQVACTRTRNKQHIFICRLEGLQAMRGQLRINRYTQAIYTEKHGPSLVVYFVQSLKTGGSGIVPEMTICTQPKAAVGAVGEPPRDLPTARGFPAILSVSRDSV